jgi:hypothetical protein
MEVRDLEMSEVPEKKKDTSVTHGFKATAMMASGHVTCDCPFTHSAQAYQHIHPPIELHRTHSQLVLNTKLQVTLFFDHPI